RRHPHASCSSWGAEILAAWGYPITASNRPARQTQTVAARITAEAGSYLNRVRPTHRQRKETHSRWNPRRVREGSVAANHQTIRPQQINRAGETAVPSNRYPLIRCPRERVPVREISAPTDG